MKHIITVTDVPNDDYKLKVGDLVEFTDKDNNKHNMVVIPDCPCDKCCLGDQWDDNGCTRICSVFDGNYSICYNGSISGVSQYVAFSYLDNILENL